MKSIIDNTSKSKVWSQDSAYATLSPTVIQLIYKSANLDKGGNLQRH